MANESKTNTMTIEQNRAFKEDTNNLLFYLVGQLAKAKRTDFLRVVEHFENVDEKLKRMTRCISKSKKLTYIHLDTISTYTDLAYESIGNTQSFCILEELEIDDFEKLSPLHIDTRKLLLYLQQLWIQAIGNEKIILDDFVKNIEQFTNIHDRVKTLIETTKKSRAKYLDKQGIANYIDLTNLTIGIKSRYICMANSK